jgi:hypothetical protein
MSNKKFSELLNSYEEQSFDASCGQDWLDYFHTTVKFYFEKCEKENKRATIKGLQEEIVKLAKSESFEFE